MRKSLTKIHRYLAIIITIPIFIIFITGAIYAFRYEILNTLENWKFYDKEVEFNIPPSKAIESAKNTLNIDSLSVSTISYAPNRAMFIEFITKEHPQRWLSEFSTIYINPETGNIVRIQEGLDGSSKFFTWLLLGHKYLWLPAEIGRPIVGWSVVLLLIVLLSGVALCWHRGKLRLHYKKSWKQLHRTIGFYCSLFLLTCALSGLIWSFDSFGNLIFKLTSGNEMPPYQIAESVIPETDNDSESSSLYERLDKLFQHITTQEAPNAQTYFINLPSSETSTFWCSIAHEYGGFYKVDNLMYDQYSLSEIEIEGIYNGRYDEKNFAETLRRMNFEIHDGRIFGLAGRIIILISVLCGIFLIVSGLAILCRKK